MVVGLVGRGVGGYKDLENKRVREETPGNNREVYSK